VNETAREELARVKRRLIEVTGAIDAHAIAAEWNADGTVRSVNDKFCKVTQFSREELIGKPYGIFKST
jgi:two-component system sensor histidine kinase NreB